jgi:hypothetical protein
MHSKEIVRIFTQSLTYIQKDEIIKCIQKLKNNKAGGEDAIINEYIKTTSNPFIEIYEKLSLKIAVNSLLKQLTNVIGLKFLGSLLSPLFL